jgi:hypothetical protein
MHVSSISQPEMYFNCECNPMLFDAMMEAPARRSQDGPGMHILTLCLCSGNTLEELWDISGYIRKHRASVLVCLALDLDLVIATALKDGSRCGSMITSLPRVEGVDTMNLDRTSSLPPFLS